ncbi:hypothetical protein KEU06_00330 [Pseudaminobacter sp. 19-2017]|uniref:Uncharacterized protein n=1 Tax=Pseudaminobacter soli (ex Zhang et al. 2022) TaxID=2831468 RepID=A0A942DV14_9HYPH|nr:Orn/Lys/Arg decarboxylase N-terminal domain-containing protein [Pseudaminobacter soli]MBS3647071.1 hypothetical protein [Pseudaminobacter soli]
MLTSARRPDRLGEPHKSIIDEDYEGRHSAGRGMQQLAAAIEKEGFRIVGGINYKDARRLAEIFNSKSCWLISVDGSEDESPFPPEA